MSLHDMFFTKVRGITYVYLTQGLMKEWNVSFVYRFIDEIIEETLSEINLYLQANVVTITNMNFHAEEVVKRIIIPYASQKRID